MAKALSKRAFKLPVKKEEQETICQEGLTPKQAMATMHWLFHQLHYEQVSQ